MNDDGCREVFPEEVEGEYEWIREYHREKKETDERRTYLLRLGEEQVKSLPVVAKRCPREGKGFMVRLCWATNPSNQTTCVGFRPEHALRSSASP